MVEEDELQEMEADPAWDVDTGAGVAAGWTTVAFLLRVEDRQVIHKMGVQVDGGAELYIGELAIYKKRPWYLIWQLHKIDVIILHVLYMYVCTNVITEVFPF